MGPSGFEAGRRAARREPRRVYWSRAAPSNAARKLVSPRALATLPRSHMQPERSSASPLVPVLGFTGLSSFAAGTATLSIFFVTEKPPYSFTAVQQYALALVVGVSY